MFVTCILIGIALIGLRTVIFIVNPQSFTFSYTFLVSCMLCLFVLFIVYPYTAFKLYQQSNIVQQQAQVHVRMQNMRTIEHKKNQKPELAYPEANTTKIHIQALKIYTAILLQFLLAAVVSSILVIVLDNDWMSYLFFVNHIGNPVIYYCSVPKFREGVSTSVRQIFRRN